MVHKLRRNDILWVMLLFGWRIVAWLFLLPPAVGLGDVRASLFNVLSDKIFTRLHYRKSIHLPLNILRENRNAE